MTHSRNPRPEEPFPCSWCGTVFGLYVHEAKRQRKKGREHFFCSGTCGAHFNNHKRGNHRAAITITCGQCGVDFQSTTHSKAAKRFCSRSCASAGSVTQHRRDVCREVGKRMVSQNWGGQIGFIAAGLRAREAWKYVGVRDLLDANSIRHLFESPLGNYVFDLALLDYSRFIEFDGPDHRLDASVAAEDLIKEQAANAAGWRVSRIPVYPSSIIPAESIASLIQEVLGLPKAA